MQAQANVSTVGILTCWSAQTLRLPETCPQMGGSSLVPTVPPTSAPKPEWSPRHYAYACMATTEARDQLRYLAGRTASDHNSSVGGFAHQSSSEQIHHVLMVQSNIDSVTTRGMAMATPLPPRRWCPQGAVTSLPHNQAGDCVETLRRGRMECQRSGELIACSNMLPQVGPAGSTAGLPPMQSWPIAFTESYRICLRN